ncbi:MAG: hypothetical protein A3G84_06730 [Chloroflexi bacterium RIFCSPLOWO2_12_FULL_71_12]|nr:MAG: hypothetical protein A3G84_06730 [Chloroflexi bacterium RIFCSPLOWO2_12_FULL_71_12]
MLHLEPRVDLEEDEGPVRRDEELARARAPVARRPRDAHRGVAETLPQLGADGGAGRLLDELLVAPLHAAVALPEPDHAPVLVRQELHLYVPAVLDEAFHQQPCVAECGARLSGRPAPRSRKLGHGPHDAHALPAAARRGLEEHGVADALGRVAHLDLVLDRFRRAGGDGHADALGDPARFRLGAERALHGGRRPDED